MLFLLKLENLLREVVVLCLKGVTPIDKGVIQAGISSAQQLTMGVTELGKLNEAIRKLKGDNSEGIKTLTSQYSQMLNLINTTNIKPDRLEQYNEIVTSFEKISEASDGFDKFQKSYSKFEKDFRATRQGINNIQLPKVQAMNKFLELNVELAKMSRQSNTEKMVENMRKFMEEFGDGMAKAMVKMEDALKGIDSTELTANVNRLREAIQASRGGTQDVRITNCTLTGSIEKDKIYIST